MSNTILIIKQGSVSLWAKRGFWRFLMYNWTIQYDSDYFQCRIEILLLRDKGDYYTYLHIVCAQCHQSCTLH